MEEGLEGRTSFQAALHGGILMWQHFDKVRGNHGAHLPDFDTAMVTECVVFYQITIFPYENP